MVRIGVHIDGADPLAAASARGADAVQFFLGDPQGWKGPVLPGEPAEVRAAFAAAGVDAYVHAPYVINVATTNNRIRIPSRKLLTQQLEAAASIGAKALIVHGGHVTSGVDPAEGYANWRKVMERVERPIPLLIENTAGGTNAMARTLDAIGQLWDAVMAGVRDGDGEVGFCLDTCHAYVGRARPRRRDRQGDGHHRPDRSGALQQLTRRVRLRPRPARGPDQRDDRPGSDPRGGPGRWGARHLRNTG